ncbi:MAG: hypothetical protein SNH05_09625 [Rikenellaceae bacterium]
MNKNLLYLLLMLVSCSGESSKVKHDLASLTSQSIEFCNEAKTIVNGCDSPVQDYFANDLKMIVYTDSTSCNTCALNKLYLWDDLINYAKPYNGTLKFYFIFNPPKGENIRLALRNSMLDYPMLLDSLGEFERLNPHLPKNKAMHTFLLDENNNVVLVGNPLHNPKIEQMFKDIVEEKLGKKE